MNINPLKIEKMEKKMDELINAINELTIEISALNQGQMWDGTLVDALNEVAKAIREKGE